MKVTSQRVIASAPDPWLAEYEASEALHWRTGRCAAPRSSWRLEVAVLQVCLLPTRDERRAYLARFQAEHGEAAAELLRHAVEQRWPQRKAVQ